MTQACRHGCDDKQKAHEETTASQRVFEWSLLNRMHTTDIHQARRERESERENERKTQKMCVQALTQRHRQRGVPGSRETCDRKCLIGADCVATVSAEQVAWLPRLRQRGVRHTCCFASRHSLRSDTDNWAKAGPKETICANRVDLACTKEWAH